VLSRDLVEYVSRNALLLKMYRNEDASMGAWLAGLDVHYVHDPRFDTEFRSRGCSNQYLITHKQSPADLESLYRTLIDTGNLCRSEYRSRASYVYDWAQPPSLCCARGNDSRIP
jgi:galactosylxylosylprotein 3-beta-galactosyltransferase